MRSSALPLLFLTALASAIFAGPLAAAPPEPGQFRLAEGPDVAGGLVLHPEGNFEYFLSAGALDEQASGRWELRGEAICLFTDPKPVPPAFVRAEIASSDDANATLLVTWPNGRGIAGIDFLIGFNEGDPIEGYTQEYGWSMPADDTRIPQWIEVSEPIHRLPPSRFDLDPQDNERLRLVLMPNDLGTVDFDGACLETFEDGVILHRKEGDMRFRRDAMSLQASD